MTSFFFAVAGFVLATVALGLVRVLRGPATERIMAVQLLGTGGVAVILLLSVATDNVAIVDVALALALLAAFASIAFATSPGLLKPDVSEGSKNDGHRG
jgi:multicomponent Na+:H+ antiporter subunit F